MIVTYQDRFREAFARLNRQWIELHFRLEPMDLAQLEAPEKIMAQGGEIFFVIEDDEAVGTCALLPHGPAAYELAKMAVDPRVRGRGYGDDLLIAALAWTRARGAERVFLLSNTILAPAIRLYEKHGFRTTRLGPHPDYERCNIEMELR